MRVYFLLTNIVITVDISTARKMTEKTFTVYINSFVQLDKIIRFYAVHETWLGFGKRQLDLI